MTFLRSLVKPQDIEINLNYYHKMSYYLIRCLFASNRHKKQLLWTRFVRRGDIFMCTHFHCSVHSLLHVHLRMIVALRRRIIEDDLIWLEVWKYV